MSRANWPRLSALSAAGSSASEERPRTAPHTATCRPTYKAQAYSPREQRTLRKTFASLAEARAWRQETQVALRQRAPRAPTRTTLADWLRAAKAGVVRTRSGEPYKPSATRSYEQALATKLLPSPRCNAALGARAKRHDGQVVVAQSTV